MAIKSTVVGGKQGIHEWMFPCLGKTGDGLIVLFSRHGQGMGLTGVNVGYYANAWPMSKFTPLDPSEVVQLQNEG